ncbi:MAG: kelch repeat-containing protein [Actinomycetota bacterium]|nr:kelch repeat-containing protein [Actinomycetota bacterium]
MVKKVMVLVCIFGLLLSMFSLPALASDSVAHPYDDASFTTEQLSNSSSSSMISTALFPSGWGSLAPMPTPRADFAAVRGADGKIYCIGGTNGWWYRYNALRINEAYDPKTDTWQVKAQMMAGRRFTTGAQGSDGKIYVFGGFPGHYGHSMATVEAYNPKTDTWEAKAPLPRPRCCCAAVTGPDGKIYVIGGHDSTTGWTMLNDVDIYDPGTNTWRKGAPMPTARCRIAATLGPDGKIYVAGGEMYLKTFEAYDPKTDTWQTRPSMPTGRRWPGAATGADGKIYVMGGYWGASYWGYPTGVVEAYNPTTNTWSAPTHLPTARAYLGTVTFGSKIYAIGGLQINRLGDPYFLGNVEAYETAASLTLITELVAEPTQFDPYEKDGKTTISYVLGRECSVSIKVMDSSGKVVKEKLPRTGEAPGAKGSNTVVWNGVIDFPELNKNTVNSDDLSVFLAPDGIYTIKVTAKDKVNPSITDTKETKVKVKTSW